ncbi:unnamed protein product [Gongylonema pulchrum]|uniref:Uncharacterized protein n=1 Tax=Gongylonema pulchrum TaxID=637853 RepID=A0A183EQT2_9BILA|nr:unnamed protein product [Gongylonema pulchrum]
MTHESVAQKRAVGIRDAVSYAATHRRLARVPFKLPPRLARTPRLAFEDPLTCAFTVALIEDDFEGDFELPLLPTELFETVREAPFIRLLFSPFLPPFLI